MSLLAPLFLLGLVLVGLPLWLHRRREPHQPPQPFSSTMLLTGDPQPLRVRRRWRYRTLLALRLLLLALLCVAFAQPLWPRRQSPTASAAPLQLIVLDTSLSMGAQGRFTRAVAEARRLIDGLGGGQRAQLLTADSELTVVAAAGSEPTADRAALRAALAGLAPGTGRLDFGTAMSGLDSVLARRQGAIDVHFISDLQDTGLPTRFADLVPQIGEARTVRVLLHPVAQAEAAPNWAITGITRAGSDISVSVRGFATPARTLGVALSVNGREVARQQQAVNAGAEGVFRFANPLLAAGHNRISARLVFAGGAAGPGATAGDALAADDVRYAVIDNAAPDPVPLLTAAPSGRAAIYLSTALAAGGAGFAADVQPLERFDARALPRYRWAIVDDLGALGDPLAMALSDYVKQGGALFAALGEQSAARDRLPVLGDALAGQAGSVDAPLSVGALDAGSTLLSGLAGWQAVTLTRLLQLTPQSGDRVLVSASNGAPLLLERTLGRGRVLLYAGDLADAGNDLPVQPLFVGLMAQIARSLSGRGQLPSQLTVGDPLALGEAGGSAGQLIDPAGRPVLSLADTRRAPMVRVTQMGFYEIYTSATEALVAVNPDPLESDLTAMPAETLARWRAALAAGPPVPAAAEARGSRVQRALAPALLALLGLLVIAESLFGNTLLGLRAPERA